MDLKKKVWSYSSLKLYETCKYAFYRKYVEGIEEQPNAFSLFGKHAHSVLERYFKGELYAFELADVFEQEYETAVPMHFPYFNMFKSFYDKTLRYFQEFDGIEGEVLGVEQKLEGRIGKHKFIGFADLIMRDDKGIFIIDHKSHGNWKSQKERHEYFRQLYLYAHFVHEMYGVYPYKLVFNKFCADEPLDEEPFNVGDYCSAIDWFTFGVDMILMNEDWDCEVDNFYCQNLCKVGCVYGGDDI